MTFIVGLTGGIGSGKSAAATLFEQLGAAVVDTDAIAHALTAPGGAAIEPIRAVFGDEIVDPRGALDRAAMRRRVFADARAKARLEGILHPMIRDEADRCCAAARSAYVVLVVPLLVESGGYRSRVQRVAVVDCPEDVQVARVMARSGLSAEEARAIMAAQVGRQARLAVADDVIDNGGSLDALRPQVEALHRRYLEMAAVS
ncbi:MAG: Dephospho-CoA kinase [Rhodocyclaceae bacterium]|nr:MAG: dephospho-CoA kinase [Rhodocyclaceae bacterium]MBE7423670.1 dephospho-CoA kinase [Zoogloeaceae bacterium]MBV6406457.1 Dephospho-CoA kinase [Rhodocyclaceae bacterium]MCK6385398.1 dephospho-CoA kinase [Rhodocyclaceae bacterium]CAG0944669.1 dephospho-CoA kinase [Gammaproteobacteria bacterium]